MPLSTRVQANLDRYLASFTPDISDQRERISECAEETHRLDKSYNDALGEIDRVRKELANLVGSLRTPVAGALSGEDDEVDSEALITALDGIVGAVEDFGHEMDEIFMEMVPTSNHDGFFPLQALGHDLMQIHDDLDTPARHLDELAERRPA